MNRHTHRAISLGLSAVLILIAPLDEYSRASPHLWQAAKDYSAALAKTGVDTANLAVEAAKEAVAAAKEAVAGAREVLRRADCRRGQLGRVAEASPLLRQRRKEGKREGRRLRTLRALSFNRSTWLGACQQIGTMG